jgi:hypothetical protein
MKFELQREHQWLHKLVGEWTYEGECSAGPGEAPTKYGGSERVRSVGNFWIVAEGQGEMPGCGTASTIMTLGFDPQRQRYIGTWIGSMMSNLWIYDGAIDAAGRVLSLDAEGPSMSGDGKMAKYQDVIELKGDDHRVLRARVMRDDGTWNEFMRTDYRRWE